MTSGPATVTDLSEASLTRALCVLLVLQAVVSYRSVPRILRLFKTETMPGLAWTPHFTSVINWTLRLGLGLLNQVKAIKPRWLAIIDHSIDIGTKKVLVVLRVSVAVLANKGAAIQLQDCECIGLKVCEQVNGESIALDLAAIFTQAGAPAAIIKDGDATLAKGVRLWSGTQDGPVPVIADIGHAMAIALKEQFEKAPAYQRLTTLTTQGAARLRQTDLAFLTPPKLRSKGRFQSISTLGKWADKMLDVFSVKGGAQKGSVLARLRTALPGLLLLKPFIKRFAHTTQVVSEVLGVLKNQGLSQATYEHSLRLSETLPNNSKVKRRLQQWLHRHIAIQQDITDMPLLVSSDIIESLFGNFKHAVARSPQADMNRTALLIPALCGNLGHITVTQALEQTRHKDLEAWEAANIPYTIRKKRRAFFGKTSQKPGIT